MKYLEGPTSSANAGSHNANSVDHHHGGKKSGGGRQSKHLAQNASLGNQKELVATVFVSMLTFFLITYAFHCVWATSEAYSSPSIVLTARTHDGSRIIFDDFRYNQYSILKFSGIDL